MILAVPISLRWVPPQGDFRLGLLTYPSLLTSMASTHRFFGTPLRSEALRIGTVAAATFAGSLALLAEGGIAHSPSGWGHLDPISAALAGCSTMPLVLWRRYPFGVFVTTGVASVLLAGLSIGSLSKNPTPQRFAWVTGLEPEKAAYYKELHANPWPGVLKTLRECHVQNFSIHLKELDGKQYLFAYLEYTGDNFDSDMKKMGADPETQRWWKETDFAVEK